MERTNEEIKEAVIKALRQIHNKGKDITKGWYGDATGNVQLSATNYSQDSLSVNYCCGSNMWTWIIAKSEIYELSKQGT